MKFFKASITAIVIILLITVSTIVLGVYYALEVSDRENNAYYTELSYNFVKQHFTKYFDLSLRNLFYSSEYYELKNQMLYRLSGRSDVSAMNSSLENFAKHNDLTHYYYLSEDGQIYSNSDDELIKDLINKLDSDDIAQHILFQYEDEKYVGFARRMTSVNQSYMIFYSDFNHIINTPHFNDSLVDSGLISIDYIGYYTPPAEKSLTFIPYQSGYLDIGCNDYNVIYLSVDSDNLENTPINQAIEVHVSKPEIINSIRRRIMMIIFIIIISFIFFTLIMLYFSKKISKSLESVVDKINRIAKGEYHGTVIIKGIKEFEDISHSINTMAATIDDKISELSGKNEEMLKIMIEALESTDFYTKGHSDRVAKYVYLLGQQMAYPDLNVLMSAALLHDIGKIAVPEHILNKPGKLNVEEYDRIKEHVDTGYRILNKSKTFGDIESLVRCHHERIDGKGYPRGLKGEDIPLGAQMISICDVYDALTSSRPYRSAMTHEKALNIIITEKGKQFSNCVVEAFLKLDFQLIS